jgi:hypothetical protein
MNEYHRRYYADHKSQILKQLSTPEFCTTCKKYISHGYMSKHLQCPRHIKLKEREEKDRANILTEQLRQMLLRLTTV